ncbi:hypothetical protein ES288_A03G197800v1, partial [Gossypium darwinii]
GKNSGGGGNIRTEKIFVKGLPPTLTEYGRRDAREFKGGVKCPLMAELELFGGVCSVWGLFGKGLAQLKF